MNGKGDKWRNGVNFKNYWINFPELTEEYKTKAVKIEKKKNKTTFVYKAT